MSKIGQWVGGNMVCSGPSTAQQPCTISAAAKLMSSLSFFGKSYLKGVDAEPTWHLTVQSGTCWGSGRLRVCLSSRQSESKWFRQGLDVVYSVSGSSRLRLSCFCIDVVLKSKCTVALWLICYYLMLLNLSWSQLLLLLTERSGGISAACLPFLREQCVGFSESYWQQLAAIIIFITMFPLGYKHWN